MKQLLISLQKTFTHFKNSKNRVYFLLENKFFVVSILAIFTLLFSVIGFFLDGQGFKKTIMGIIDIFTLESPNIDNENSVFIIIARLFAISIITFTIFALFLDKFYNRFLINSISKKPYDFIIGLGAHNRAYLDNLTPIQDRVIILEMDEDNAFIQQYRKKGFGITVGNYKNDIVDLANVRNIIISVGNDAICIDIASYFSNIIKNPVVKIYTHVINRNLNIFFKDRFFEQNGIEIIPFSFESNVVKSLWQKQSILGNYNHLIQTKEDIHFAIIGNSNLAKEIVYYLTNLAQLPYENNVVIHLIGAKSKRFKKEVQRDFSSIDKIKNISLQHHNLNEKELSFYTNSLWKSENLIYVIIASENQEQNIDTALKLYDITYRKEIVDGNLKTDILVSIYDNNTLTDKFYQKYDNLLTFGSFKDIASKDVILDEKLDCISKYIHLKHSLDIPWEKLDLHKKESNIFQALHINVKLLSLGLKKEKSKVQNKSELLQINKTLFNEKISQAGVSPNEIETQIKEFKPEYFPKKFKNLIEFITRSEHNRWMAYHFLNGWTYDAIRDDDKKHHHYLVPLEQFKGNNDKMMTYQYDVMALFNIPEYLAECGFEIVVY